METLEQKNINSQFFFMVMLSNIKRSKNKSQYLEMHQHKNLKEVLSENEFP